ncbi:MAG: hypothetical protein H0U52_13795 [Chloroflexi bacterium]|nr:hypothetical protein [Chloroflexota bacterium]
MDDLERRIRDAGSALADLREPLVAGEPWPLSEHWGTEPEADWGPREVLAHVSEMLPYWTDQLQNVIAGDPATAVAFGRIASDPSRLARIDAERQRPVGEILDALSVGLDEAATFAGGAATEHADRLGLHSTRGEITVRASVERFFVTHLEEHVEQLRSILSRHPA